LTNPVRFTRQNYVGELVNARIELACKPAIVFADPLRIHLPIKFHPFSKVPQEIAMTRPTIKPALIEFLDTNCGL
jgi:hypothetical protein